MNSRILMVANWDWVLYNFRLPLAQALMDRGVEVILVSPPGRYVQKLKDMGYKWKAWEMDRRSVFPGNELISIWKLFFIYWKFKPRAVHHITIKPILYGSIAARLSGIPQVINNYTGLGYLFSDQPQAKRLRRFILPLMRWALQGRKIHSVLLNKGDFKTLLSMGIISQQQSSIISSDGVDTDRFHPPQESERFEGEPIVILAARLLRDKGIIEFLEAACKLHDEGVQARFWVAGEPDPGNPTSITREELEKYSKNDFIKFLGHRDDMPDLLQKASVAVLPSYHEGVPMFLLEAAAAGLPLIGTDIEGCRMIIEDGENGYLVPSRNVEELAETMKKLVTNPAMRAKMGEESRSIVEARFDEKQIVDQFLNLYRQLGVL